MIPDFSTPDVGYSFLVGTHDRRGKKGASPDIMLFSRLQDQVTEGLSSRERAICVQHILMNGLVDADMRLEFHGRSSSNKDGW